MILKVKVIPGARKNEILKRNDEFLIKVTVQPEKGKANKEVIRVLADYFKVKIGQISIKKGASSHHKIIEILK
jgi:uncharacterized protein (TIGR00251 family)